MIRGFQVVQDTFRKTPGVDITLPTRADSRSAGYDFYLPHDVYIPGQGTEFISTDVKAYMGIDEVLNLYIRSSLAIKKGLILVNSVGIIDASYYENADNDGNIGLCLKNNNMFGITLARGERVMQGIFTKYLEADEDVTLSSIRSGGIGSSGV